MAFGIGKKEGSLSEDWKPIAETTPMDVFTDPGVLMGVGVVILTVLVFFVLMKISNKKKNALDPEKFIPFKLIDKVELTHDTRRFVFALQTPETVLGLPIGQHISFRFKDGEGKVCQRSYTPTTGNDTLGRVEFVIKVYFANKHPKFPEGGKMSQHLESLKIGDTLEMRGPKGHLDYKGSGNFTLKKLTDVTEKTVTKVGMMAGGTGITPMLQVIKAILKEGSGIELSLLFANQSEDDILLRADLDELARKHANFKVWYTVDRPPKHWTFSEGFINKKMVDDHMPKPADDTLILMCGPGPMVKMACLPALKELGFDEKKHTFTF